MKQLMTTLALFIISFGILQSNVYAMDIHEYIKTESAKIDWEFNCTVDGSEQVFLTNTKDPLEAAKRFAEAKPTQSSAVCVVPQYVYSCFLPKNQNIPLSGSLTYYYWTNESTLERFKNSEQGKKLRACQGAW